jgi:hypothetical protein
MAQQARPTPAGVSTGADVELRDLPCSDEIGVGGEGKVFVVNNSLLYKQYHDPARVNGAALARLVTVHQRSGPRERRWLDRTCAWPKCRVVDQGRVVGFVMSKARGTFSWRDTGGRRRLTELQYLVRPAKPMWRRISQPDPAQRLALAVGLAELVAGLHARHITIGDISHANILWTIDPQPAVYLIDCDGLRVGPHPPVSPPVATPGWEDPQQLFADALPDNDNYKLALALGRILACAPDIQPGDSLRLVPGVVDEARAVLLTAQFDLAAGRAGTRATARQWLDALTGAAAVPARPPAQPPPPGQTSTRARPIIRLDQGR